MYSGTGIMLSQRYTSKSLVKELSKSKVLDKCCADLCSTFPNLFEEKNGTLIIQPDAVDDMTVMSKLFVQKEKFVEFIINSGKDEWRDVVRGHLKGISQYWESQVLELEDYSLKYLSSVNPDRLWHILEKSHGWKRDQISTNIIYWSPRGLMSQPPVFKSDYFLDFFQVMEHVKNGEHLLKNREELAVVEKENEKSCRSRANNLMKDLNKTFGNRIVGKLPVKLGDEWYTMTEIRLINSRRLYINFLEEPYRELFYEGQQKLLVVKLSNLFQWGICRECGADGFHQCTNQTFSLVNPPEVLFCSICQEPCKGYTRLPCGHPFHWICLSNLAKSCQTSACPNCRKRHRRDQWDAHCDEEMEEEDG